MNNRQLIVRSLLFYWRTHIAVLLGVIAGTAVISGALVVGDSVRFSLRQMSLDRLGGIDHALHSPRMIRMSLADEMSVAPGFSDAFGSVAPVLIMDGALVQESESGQVVSRAGGIRVYGVDSRFAELTEFNTDSLPTGDEIVLSDRVASQLNAQPGSQLTLWVEMPATIPRESLLGGIEDQDTQDLPLTLKSVLPEDSGVGRFDLNPGQQLPLAVFVSLDTLQEATGLSEVRRSKEFPEGRQARVNSLMLSGREEPSHPEAAWAAERSATATHVLNDHLTLADLNLRLAEHPAQGYVAVESEQMILEDVFADAVASVAEQQQRATSPVLVYLINEFHNPDAPDALSMYSIVAGVDFADVAARPFGPLWVDPSAVANAPAGDQIVVSDWLAESMQLGPGSQLKMVFHPAGSTGELPELDHTFTVHSVVPLASSATASDRGLTPQVRGITDAKNFREWKQPFPMDLNRIPERDDEYFETYKALPKAFVPLKTAQQLWTSRYGKLTSVRVAMPVTGEGELATIDVEPLQTALLKEIGSRNTGLVFRPVKQLGVAAASGTMDFTGLFIGFSFFVIVAAVILIGLLFRLGVERRTSGLGLLRAVGLEQRQVRSLILREGLLVAASGTLFGSYAAVKYAQMMVFALRDPDWWGGAIGTRFLQLHVSPVSVAVGAAISLLVALLALMAALRGLSRVPVRQLLAGESEVQESAVNLQAVAARRARAARVGFGICALLVVAGLAGMIPDSEAFSGFSWQIVAFFVTGISMLASSLTGLSAWLMAGPQTGVRGAGLSGVMRLGMRNAARNRLRSILSAGLVAFATFVIVAVAAGRRDPSVEVPSFDSGNGGFSLVAETTVPIIGNLNTTAGREQLNLPTPEDETTRKLLNDVEILPFRVRPGENASCLNLYQTRLPTVLGVPDELVQRGGFRFINASSADYWKLLASDGEDGTIPVLGDMNTLMYSLHKGPGAVIEIPESDQTLTVAGMMDSSVFQGVLLMSDRHFQKLFPEQSGFRYFLIGATAKRLNESGPLTRDEEQALTAYFEQQLTPYGFDAERVLDRIAAFLIVQNTYLSTFQSLGGLGLLLGTLGLATVMLRNVVDRRAELALLRAVGFRQGTLAVMVLAENALLLVWGLSAGTGCALMAMLPHLKTSGADTPWAEGGLLLAIVFGTGMLAALFAVREASRTPIVSTLRGE